MLENVYKGVDLIPAVGATAIVKNFHFRGDIKYYYYDEEYSEDGNVGDFNSIVDATNHALKCGYENVKVRCDIY